MFKPAGSAAAFTDVGLLFGAADDLNEEFLPRQWPLRSDWWAHKDSNLGPAD
jgi:hypothetical protein